MSRILTRKRNTAGIPIRKKYPGSGGSPSRRAGNRQDAGKPLKGSTKTNGRSHSLAVMPPIFVY